MCSLHYTICSCQEYVCSTVKLSQFLLYLPKHALHSSSCFTILKDQQSGLDMEIWLTPIRTSTYERPFTREGNYLVIYLSLIIMLSFSPCIKLLCQLPISFLIFGNMQPLFWVYPSNFLLFLLRIYLSYSIVKIVWESFSLNFSVRIPNIPSDALHVPYYM